MQQLQSVSLKAAPTPLHNLRDCRRRGSYRLQPAITITFISVLLCASQLYSIADAQKVQEIEAPSIEINSLFDYKMKCTSKIVQKLYYIRAFAASNCKRFR